MGKSEISPKEYYRGGFLQNHVVVDGDDMAVHNVDIRERLEIGIVAELVDASPRYGRCGDNDLYYVIPCRFESCRYCNP